MDTDIRHTFDGGQGGYAQYEDHKESDDLKLHDGDEDVNESENFQLFMCVPPFGSQTGTTKFILHPRAQESRPYGLDKRFTCF